MNMMMTALFRPVAELTLFWRMHTKVIATTWGKCMPMEELFPYYSKSR